MSDQPSSSSEEQHVFDLEDAQTANSWHGFERYQIERSLGSGAMATVLLATDKILDRKVAIKVPLIKSEKNTELIEKRFLREAQAVARLSHPNICPIHDVGLADGTYYISMAYIEGRPLNEIMEETDRFEEAEVAQIIQKIASGVGEAHRQGFVHRDLKPGNIMVDRRGEPIVLDFGLARFFDNSQLNQTLTMTGQTVGTPAYMSPEQVMGRRDLGPTSDIFSLGVVLWEMLCGDRPFTGDTMSMLRKIVNDPSPSPKSQRPEISPEMEAICLKAIAKKSEQRFQSMQELEQALGDLLAGRRVESSVPASQAQIDSSREVIDPMHETRIDPDVRDERRGTLPVWVWGLIGILILIIVSFMVRPMFTRPRQATQPSQQDLPEIYRKPPAEIFKTFDRDRNDIIVFPELPLFVIERADDNQNGRLEREEFLRGYEKYGFHLFDTQEGKPPPANMLFPSDQSPAGPPPT